MKLSHVRGSTDVPLLTKTIGQALDHAASAWGDVEAVRSCEQDVTLTWGELADRSRAFAAGLLDLGLCPGDRIGIWSLNCVEWTITQFAAARAGLILVTINPAYRLFELDYVLRDVGCAAIVIAPPFKTSDYPTMMATLLPEIASSVPGHLCSSALPALKLVVQIGQVVTPGMMPFDAVLAKGAAADPRELDAAEADVRPDHAANIQFTSGTTGSPKGVTLSHSNILNNGYFTGLRASLRAGDRLCIPVPLYHCFGMVMGNLACVTHGMTMIYPGVGFDAAATLRAIEQERCTALYGVSTMFIGMLDHPRFDDFSMVSLRAGIMAGSLCPPAVMRRVHDRMNMRDVTICYGMTETSPVSYQSAIGDTIERRVSTVGQVHPHLESRIVDPDGVTVPRGAAGEICTRGYAVMIGYWNDPQQTAAVMDQEGWIRTGDLGVLDEDGYCTIVGRLKDLVIRGGENLYPREIEDFLHTHPAIKDVQVFGVSDDKFGEELCVWIALMHGASLSEGDVRQFCHGRIAHNKIPRYIQFVDTFPMTITGKVQKFVMREEMETALKK